MERIKDELNVRERKILIPEGRTGHSAFITPAHKGVAVAKLIKDDDGTIRSAEGSTYHEDVPRAVMKMASLEAKGSFEEGVLLSYLEKWDASVRWLYAKFEEQQNKTQQQQSK